MLLNEFIIELYRIYLEEGDMEVQIWRHGSMRGSQERTPIEREDLYLQEDAGLQYLFIEG